MKCICSTILCLLKFDYRENNRLKLCAYNSKKNPTSLLFINDPILLPAVECIWETLLSGMRGCVAWYRFLLDHQCTPGRWWSVAGGWWECLVSLTPCFSWVTESSTWMNRTKGKLCIFSSSDICCISQKRYLNNHVVKSCFNKNSFHIQFYIMRTFQNALAHSNIPLLMWRKWILMVRSMYR